MINNKFFILETLLHLASMLARGGYHERWKFFKVSRGQVPPKAGLNP
jgi:hypothetical protein